MRTNSHTHSFGRILRLLTVTGALAGALIPVPTFAAIYDAFGGLQGGVFMASGIAGLLVGTPSGVVNTVLANVVTYVALAATVTIVIAGFYLILGLGDETSRDRAKRIILYTAIGVLVILLASAIVAFIMSLGTGSPDGSLRAAVVHILLVAIGYLALAAVITIVIAGFYLVLGLGEESSKDKAKKIIMYTIAGLLIILFVRVIVAFVLNLA